MFQPFLLDNKYISIPLGPLDVVILLFGPLPQENKNMANYDGQNTESGNFLQEGIYNSFKALDSNTYAEKIIVFPNPLKTELNVEIHIFDSNPIYFEVFDITGRKILCQKIINKTNNIISFSNFYACTYLYRISNSNRILKEGNLVLVK